jgi:serine/threonine protein kinase
LIGIERKTEVLGSGACTTVSAEWDPLLGHSVVIKELNSPFAQNEAFARAFLAKAERLFDFEHENVLAIYRVDAGRRAPAFIREIAEETLEAAVLAGPLPPARVEEILRDALLGLRAMHARGMVHGAVKPRNLFQCGDRVKIGDFGMTGVPGAPPAAINPYMAPELLRGEAATPASDLYALGIAAYELLLGRARFEQLSRVDLPPLDGLLPGVPRPLALAVEQMTRKAAAYRAAGADQVLAALGVSDSAGTRGSAFSATGTSALDARLRPEAPKPVLDTRKLKRIVAIAVAVLLVVLVVSATFFLRNQNPEGHGAVPKTAPAKPGTSAQPQGQPPALQTTAPAAPPVVGGSPSVPTAPSQAPPQTATSAKHPSSPATTMPQPVIQLHGNGNANVEETPTPSKAAEAAPPPKRIPLGREVIFDIQPSSYQLGTIHSGQRAYMDLEAVYTDLPERHDRLPCIETAVADRDKDRTMSFDLSRDARVYVGHDHSIKRKPNWLREFHPTDETWSVLMGSIGGSAGEVHYYDVYTRSYPAGVVNLGPNMENRLLSTFRSLGGRFLGKGEPGMYLVCVDAR